VTWWRDGVIYQIYPRSYRDANGDGVGDLAGITERLDHLAWLGVDAIWITPITVSPDNDWGYDVAHYMAVQPVLGDLDAFDRLVAEAAARGIRVVLDLVPNHTSSKHPWFREARASRTSPRRDYYVWADPKPDGSPPNNWRSSFGGPAWTRDPVTGQYYLHNFLPTQPDLNWWSEAVREEFDRILRFWFDRGVAGFRIDVCHAIVKDKELRDNVRNAYSSARAVYDELSSRRRMSDAASQLAGDKDLQDEIRSAIDEIRNAAGRVKDVKRGAPEPARTAKNSLLLMVGIFVGLLLNPITGPALRRMLARQLFGSGNDFVYQGNGSKTSS